LIRNSKQKFNNGFWLRCLLTSLLFFQLSGLAHIADDLLDDLLHPGVQHQECPDERAGSECPPGCPDCHCVYAAAFTLPLRTLRLLAPPPRPNSPRPLAANSQAPAQPLLASIFRPPRPAANLI